MHDMWAHPGGDEQRLYLGLMVVHFGDRWFAEGVYSREPLTQERVKRVLGAYYLSPDVDEPESARALGHPLSRLVLLGVSNAIPEMASPEEVTWIDLDSLAGE